MKVLFKAKTAFVFSILVLFLALGTAFGSVPVTVSVTSAFDKSPVAIKDTAKATVKASATAPMNDESHIYDKASLWKWTWEIVSAPTNSTPTVTQDSSDPTQAYVSSSFSESGDYTITVKASVWIGCSGGPAETGSGTKDLSDTAVKVKTIQFSVGGGSYQDVPSTFYA